MLTTEAMYGLAIALLFEIISIRREDTMSQCLRTSHPASNCALEYTNGTISGVSDVAACEAWITPCLSMSGASAGFGVHNMNYTIDM